MENSMLFSNPENPYTTIIVDASSNHCGDMKMAKEMIQTAAEIGVDIIKFQSWQASKLKVGDPNYERHKKAELSNEDHYDLIKECQKNDIQFLTSCFDVERVDFLCSLGLDMIKLPSSELTSLKMIKLLAKKFDKLIFSTGAAYKREIEEVMNILKDKKVALLHCNSIYPTPVEKSNLTRMYGLREYTPFVGLSDHSLGHVVSEMAIGMGAHVIEKHFTLDRNLPGKDQKMSSTPEDMKHIVDFRNDFVKAYGDAGYKITEEEINFRKQYIGKWGDNRN